MAAPRRFDLEDILIRPGTYFNPSTEVLLIVDDSPQIDREIFDDGDDDGAAWVLISDETPIDEDRRDELLERFDVSYHPAGRRAGASSEDLDLQPDPVDDELAQPLDDELSGPLDDEMSEGDLGEEMDLEEE